MEKKNWARVAMVVLLCGTLTLSGCSMNWISEGEEIVSVLIPAATNIVAVVAALAEKTVSTADVQTIQTAGAQAEAGLQLIQSLMAAYEKADASAQPGILSQIETAINTVQNNLQNLLPALHIKDAATQAKITAVVGLVLSEVQSLAALVPLVKAGAGSPTLAAKNATRVGQSSRARAPLAAEEFVASYNAMLTAKTGNADLDRTTAGLKIHAHNKAERWATAGWLK
jgi:hypothetical protein